MANWDKLFSLNIQNGDVFNAGNIILRYFGWSKLIVVNFLHHALLTSMYNNNILFVRKLMKPIGEANYGLFPKSLSCFYPDMVRRFKNGWMDLGMIAWQSLFSLLFNIQRKVVLFTLTTESEQHRIRSSQKDFQPDWDGRRCDIKSRTVPIRLKPYRQHDLTDLE